ncbi:hypothetical protein T01_9244 [Trichinella spiralis]|uniref:Uncharacterized protein n=1 Tax=Trichinella spiralis TaxID=6334 RepID=A0A0V1ASD9_TRISP|nr:hypothetical protein T01_9244 [Trichinella spiralis]
MKTSNHHNHVPKLTSPKESPSNTMLKYKFARRSLVRQMETDCIKWGGYGVTLSGVGCEQGLKLVLTAILFGWHLPVPIRYDCTLDMYVYEHYNRSSPKVFSIFPVHTTRTYCSGSSRRASWPYYRAQGGLSDPKPVPPEASDSDPAGGARALCLLYPRPLGTSPWVSTDFGCLQSFASMTSSQG